MSMMHLFGFSREVPYEQLCQTTGSLLHRSAPEKIGNFLGLAPSSKGKRSSVVLGGVSGEAGVGLGKRNSVLGGKARGKTSLKKTSRVKSIAEHKLQVGEYFCAQLYLMADLCLDRNYLAMRHVESQFSLELLLTLLKNPASTPKIKAPVCKLIRCLFVDREPQIEIRFPRLIRTLLSSSTSGADSRGGSTTAGTGEVSSAREVQFLLLQELISEYLHTDLDIHRCDELSSEMLDLLLSLMRFGFFSQETQLLDIVVPLSRLLDKHRSPPPPTSGSASVAESISGEEERVESIPEASSPPPWGLLQRIWLWRPHSETNPRHAIQPFPSHSAEASTEHDTRRPERVAPLPGTPHSPSYPLTEDPQRSSSPLLSSSQHRLWCRSLLEGVESTSYTLFVLFLVFFSTSVAILNAAGGRVADRDYSILMAVDLAVSLVFITELTLRLYSNYVVHEEVLSFLTNRYKLLDVVVVVLDISMLCYGSLSLSSGSASLSNISRFAKTLRILRVLRLIRLLRAARLLRRISVKPTVHPPYVPPLRYSAISEHETRSLTSMLKILLIANDRMQDRKLGDLIQRYSQWFDESFQDNSAGPKAIYAALCEESTALFPQRFGEILLDVLMYAEPHLVQEALRLLMSYESQEGIFLSTAQRVQIVSSIHLEGLYNNLIEQLQLLKAHAESIELWGGLKTAADMEIAISVRDTLHQIADAVRKKVDGRKLEIDPANPVDEEVQQLLFNLDAFSVFMLLQKAILSDGNGEGSTIGLALEETLKEILRACNDCLVLFVLNNESNQVVAYEQMNWFLLRIDDDLYSSQVARAIISSNRNLIKQCPRSYVLQFIQLIVTQAQRAQFLDLLVGMAEVADEGDTGIISLRSEIARYVTNQEKLKFLRQWCRGSHTAEYEARRREMLRYLTSPSDSAPATAAVSVALSDRQLSPELQYHIAFLSLLAGCRLGHKLQAVYPLEDIVMALADRVMLYNVKRALGQLVLSLVKDKADCLEGAEAIWKFFDLSLLCLEDSREQLKSYLTKERSHLRHQYAEWLALLLSIALEFFKDFDFKMFLEQTTFETESSFLPTQRTLAEVRALILSLRREILGFKRTNAVYLGPRLLRLFDETLAVLRKKLPHSLPEDEEVSSDIAPLSVASRSRSFRKAPSMSADSVHEAFFRKQYQWFLNEVSRPKPQYFLNAVRIFQSLPSRAADLPSNANGSSVRLEPLLEKLCQHVRHRLERHPASVILDRGSITTTLWLVETWAFILSRELAISPEAGTGAGIGVRYQTVLNDCGVTALCLELIAVGIDLSLQVASLKLLTLLLLGNHGNRSVQRTLHQFLSQNESVLFFEALKDMIDQLMLWCQRVSEASDSSASSSSSSIPIPSGAVVPAEGFPEVSVLFDLVRGMCAGGFIENKDILREQHGNSRMVNLLDHFSAHLDLVSRAEHTLCLSLGISLVQTLRALIQGPCRGNQEYFVLQTNLLASLNRILRMPQAQRGAEEGKGEGGVLDSLKFAVLDVLLACIEGQATAVAVGKGPRSLVMERIQIAIELNVLNLVLMPSDRLRRDSPEDPSSAAAMGERAGTTAGEGEEDVLVELTPLQSKYLVFLRTIRKTEDLFSSLSNEIVSVEVYWQQQIHEHFFRIPAIANHISESSKSRLIEEVDLSSQDLKLKDFLRISRDLYREALHHTNLERYEISNAWDLRGYLSWASFWNCLVVNGLLLAFYRRDQQDNSLWLPEDIELTIFILLLAQVIYASWSLCIYLLVRTPVQVWSYADQLQRHTTASNKPLAIAIAKALADPLLLWSLCYLLFSLLALLSNYLFVSVCLLDFIAMNSTSRDVLKAVVYPAKQLSAAIVILLIIVNIFSMVLFHSYQHAYDLQGIDNDSLWDSFRLVITYGVRSASPSMPISPSPSLSPLPFPFPLSPLPI
jgi:hypothetical protein